MSTEAQHTANQANAQLSTGPTSEEGKAISSQNRRKFGLTGRFVVLPWEKQEEFEDLRARLCAEHQVYSPFEAELIEKMAALLGQPARRPAARKLLRSRNAAV